MQRHLNTNIHPGAILREDIIIPSKLSIGEVAEKLQVSRLTLSKVLNERGSITPNLAIRISSVFGGSAELWLRMQVGYDLIKAQQELKNQNIQFERFQMA